MKIVLKILLLKTILYFTVVGVSANTEIMSKPEMLADIAQLMDKLNNIHPNLYSTISFEMADSCLRNIVNNLPETMSKRDFIKIIMPYVALFNDGHTRVEIKDKRLNEIYEDEIGVFPIEIGISADNRIILANNYDNLAKGDEILSIDSIRTEYLVDHLLKFKSAETISFKRAALARDFALYLKLVFGIGKDAIIETRSGYKGSVSNRTIIDKIEKQPKEFDFCISDSVGYIKIDVFNNPKRYYRFIDSSFLELQKQKCTTLIIDLRDNPGGNSMLADYLHRLLIQHEVSYKTADVRVVTKVSKEAKRFYFKYSFEHPYILPFLPFLPGMWHKNGKFITKSFESTEYPISEEKGGFRGKAVLLVSNKNYSAAADFIRACKYFETAKIIGEPTGQPMVSYGDIIYFRLKKSGINVACSHREYFSVNLGPENINSTIPDISVDWSTICIENKKEFISFIMSKLN